MTSVRAAQSAVSTARTSGEVKIREGGGNWAAVSTCERWKAQAETGQCKEDNGKTNKGRSSKSARNEMPRRFYKARSIRKLAWASQ